MQPDSSYALVITGNARNAGLPKKCLLAFPRPIAKTIFHLNAVAAGFLS